MDASQFAFQGAWPGLCRAFTLVEETAFLLLLLQAIQAGLSHPERNDPQTGAVFEFAEAREGPLMLTRQIQCPDYGHPRINMVINKSSGSPSWTSPNYPITLSTAAPAAPNGNPT